MDDILDDFTNLIDTKDVVDLVEEELQQPEAAACEAQDCCYCLNV